MGYGAADDIILRGPDAQNQKKKGKGGKVVLILFLLIIILGGAAAGYWYYTNYIMQTPKDIFFKQVGQNNISKVLDLEVYYNMIDKINKQSFSAETTANFTTTKKNDFLKGIDVSKIDFGLNIASNKTSNKSLLEAKIDYSSNDLFDVKLLNTKDAIGIASDEILDKYIATNKSEFDNSLDKVANIKTDISADVVEDTLKDISNNKIELDANTKSQKAKEYIDSIYDLIPEETVTEKENVVVTIGSETINTNAYTLNLNADQYKEISKTILEKIKNDSSLLNEIVTGEKEETEKEENDNTINTIDTITNMQTQTETVEGTIETHQTETTVVAEESQLEVTKNPETILVDQTNLQATEIPALEASSSNTDKKEEKKENNFYSDLIKVLLLGQKIDSTVEDLKERINDDLSNLSSINQGISITVYVSNEENKANETIKVVAELQKDTSLDVEYTGDTKFKVTYLEPGKDEEGDDISKGTSIEVEKTSTDVNEKYNIQYNNIENKKVVSKIQMNLETDNSNPSKGYKNNLILKQNDKEGDLKLNIKNEIKFSEDAIAEELTDENAIFIDKLSEQETKALYAQITEKIFGLYFQKMLNLNFIDFNSSNSIIQQPEIQKTNTEEKEEIKKKLIEKVSTMMGEAQEKGETFTIQNLVDLSVEGYNVSSIISEDLAVIKINGYTFNIDKDFMLSEE